jgi:uncharacterized lipoprotein YmbA
MNKLSPYIHEIISFIVMLLMLVALASGQANARAYQLAALDAASDEVGRTSHVRLEDE